MRFVNLLNALPDPNGIFRGECHNPLVPDTGYAPAASDRDSMPVPSTRARRWQRELMQKVELRTRNVRATPASRKHPSPLFHPPYVAPTANGSASPDSTMSA